MESFRPSCTEQPEKSSPVAWIGTIQMHDERELARLRLAANPLFPQPFTVSCRQCFVVFFPWIGPDGRRRNQTAGWHHHGKQVRLGNDEARRRDVGKV